MSENDTILDRLSVFIDGHKSRLDQHTDCKLPYLQNIQLSHRRVTTSIGIINDPGHDEPWFIAMSDKPGYLTTLDYAARWGIEPMFSDFKSRGFGLEQSQLQTPDRLSRLLLVMSLALYFAVSTGQWMSWPIRPWTKKNATPSAKEPEPQPLVLVHQRAAAHRQDGDVQIAAASALGIGIKLMGAQPHRTMIEQVQAATRAKIDRLRSYGSASEIIDSFKRDLRSGPAQNITFDLKLLHLPVIDDLRDEFERKVRELGFEPGSLLSSFRANSKRACDHGLRTR